MLYEGTIRSVQQALEATEQGEPMLRYAKLVRAGEIMLALKSALDLANGDAQTKALYDFYSTMDARIRSLHRSSNPSDGAALIEELRSMRDAWDSIDRQNSGNR